MYQPWTEADHQQYRYDLETGISSLVASNSRGSRRQVQLPAELLTTKADQAVLRSMLDVSDEENKDEIQEVAKPAAKSSKRRRTPEREPEPEPASAPIEASAKDQQVKPKSARKKTKAEQEIIDMDTCFAGLVPRRKLKVTQDWFDEWNLEVSVPYTMRYYIMPSTGQVIVSSAEPEAAGVKSRQPEGVLYDNGNRVGPRGAVDAPATRMAKQPCECCRFK